MLLAMLSVLILLQVHLSLAQFDGCPIVSDPDRLAQMVSDAISPRNRGPPPTVEVLRSHTVCVSTGPEAGTISGLSLVVEYRCSPALHPSCASTDNYTATGVVLVEQFDFGCTFVGGAAVYDWKSKQFGVAGSRVPTANFDTAQRSDCSLCIEESVAVLFGFTDLLHFDPVTRCLGKACLFFSTQTNATIQRN